LVVSYQLSAVEWWALVWLMIQSMGSNAGLVWPLSSRPLQKHNVLSTR